MSERQATDHVMRELVKAMPMLRGWLRHLGASWDQVEEAVQETAVWCSGHAGEFTPGTSFTAWVRSVARFRLLAIWRDQGREQERRCDALLDAIPDQEWDEADDQREGRVHALGACMEHLPDAGRRLVQWTYSDGRSAQDIATALRSSVGAIHMALSRLRLRLKDCIERRLDRT